MPTVENVEFTFQIGKYMYRRTVCVQVHPIYSVEYIELTFYIGIR